MKIGQYLAKIGPQRFDKSIVSWFFWLAM